MKLIGSLTSPFVRKVRIVLAEKKLDYELILDNPWGDDPLIKTHNPLGKVPCLIMDENGVLFDSRVIVEYLDSLTPVSRLIPPPGRERIDVKRWEAVADGLMDAAAFVYTETSRRPKEQQSEMIMNRQIDKIKSALVYMEKNLSEQNYCMGVNFCLADIAVGCALEYLDLRFPDMDWRTEHPKLAALQLKLSGLAAFQATTPPKP